MIILGVDPDRGWALVLDCKVISAGTVKGIEALEKIIADVGSYCRDGRQELIVRIELSETKRPYARTQNLPLPVRFKIQGDAGANREKAKSLGRLCGRLGLGYEFVEPATRKLNAKEVKAITGYKGRTSEHSRDSIMIAWR